MLNEKIKINYIKTIDNDTFKVNCYEILWNKRKNIL